MKEINNFIIEKLKINKDSKLNKSLNIDENILWDIINIIEDFEITYPFYENCKFDIGKPFFSGKNIIVNVCFKKMSGAMWHSLIKYFDIFIKSKEKDYLKRRKLNQYTIPPIQKDNIQKIKFYIEDN